MRKCVTSVIREYEDEKDRRALRECVVELQEYERALEPLLPPGNEIAEPYVDELFRRCEETGGKTFVAEIDGRVAGFVTVLAHVRPNEPDDPNEYALVADLVLLPEYRRQGLARKLLDRAEAFCRESGATTMRVTVLARNANARQFYVRLGFADYQLQMAKLL